MDKGALYKKLVEVLLAQPKKPVRISVFGSYARSEERPDSDVDVLVKYDVPVSFFDLGFAEEALENAIHQKIDLMVEGSLKPRVQAYVDRDLVRLYP